MFTVSATLRVFAAYLGVLAVAFVFIPERVLPWIGFDPPGDFWIRILGGILFILAAYYVLAARAGDSRFARWTVWGRLPLLPFYACLVSFADAPPTLLAVGVFESGCGIWTWWTLRRAVSGVA